MPTWNGPGKGHGQRVLRARDSSVSGATSIARERSGMGVACHGTSAHDRHKPPGARDMTTNAPTIALPRWKRILFSLLLLGFACGVLELAARWYLKAFEGFD